VAALSEDGAPRRPQGRARRAALAPRLDDAVAARGADYLRTAAVGGAVIDLGKRRSPGR